MKTEILLEIDGDIEGEDITELTLKAAFMEDLSCAEFPDDSALDEYWTIEESTKAKSISEYIFSLSYDSEFSSRLKEYNNTRDRNISVSVLGRNYLLSRYGWESAFSMREMLEMFNDILEKHFNKIINGGNDNEQG